MRTHRATYLILHLALAVALGVPLGTVHLRAQSTTRTLKGLVDQCHSVVVLDRRLPVDSIMIRPPLSDSVTSAMLIAMVGSCSVFSDTQSVVPLGDLGRPIDVKFIGKSDSVTIVSPLALDTAYRTTTYQMVIPIEADTVIVDSVVTTRRWNGTSGGVVMIRADSAIAFKGTIDVSGLGFAGGLRSTNGGDCGLVIPCDRAGSGQTGGKGESVMRPDPLCSAGHRPWASGGGGGDAHNAGGGGGGNASRGGRGGDQFRCNNVNGMWGMPGTGIINDSADRVFLGGGGGGGHQNNSGGTDGAAGGGIVILRASKLIGDTVRIRSLGATVSAVALNDGGGGGGAGGTVMIKACTSAKPLHIDVSGGRGANSDAGHGPGGGGAGGFIILEPALLQLALGGRLLYLSGGLSGNHTGQPTSTYGAARGEPGRLLALCSSVTPHSVVIDSVCSVGDTLNVNLVSNDSTSFCECNLTHSITFDGWGAEALTVGTQLFTDVLVTTTVASSVTALRAIVPSRRSFSIPILAVLSQDTTIDVRSSVALHNVTGDPLCSWNEAEQTVTLDVCGYSIRQVFVTVPFRMQAWVSPLREVTCEIESAVPADATVRVYDSIGSLIEEHSAVQLSSSTQHSPTSVRFDATGWQRGVYFIVAITTRGTRSMMIRL